MASSQKGLCRLLGEDYQQLFSTEGITDRYGEPTGAVPRVVWASLPHFSSCCVLYTPSPGTLPVTGQSDRDVLFICIKRSLGLLSLTN